MFNAILALKEEFPTGQIMPVNHGGYKWKARFEWQPPFGNASVDHELNLQLPKDYLHFLKELANGCIMFYDTEYGQWGYKIYSIEEIKSKQELWRSSLGERWKGRFVAFSELYGEANVLLFDLDFPTQDLSSFAIREGNPYEISDNWPIVSRSFHEWLDHLITAQGDKYWEWK